METVFINIENGKTNEPHKFRLTLADKLNLKDPNKNIELANLSIYYILFQTCKIILSTLLKNMKL